MTNGFTLIFDELIEIIKEKQMRPCVGSFVLGIVLTACGGSQTDAPATPAIAPNSPPVLAADSAVSFAENATGQVFTIGASDPDGDIVTVTLGGVDANFFSLDAVNLTVSLATGLDFEMPVDSNQDNAYELSVSGTDGQGGMAMLAVTVTITDIDESPGVISLATTRLTDDLSRPVFALPIPDETRLVVVEQGGLVRVLDPDNGVISAVPFLDVSAEVSSGNEQGLLGLAFSPDFATDRRVYVNLTNLAGDTEIRMYETFSGRTDQVDPSTEDLILMVDQPFGNHNAGWLGFGNDGFLLIPLGDGGSAGDPNGFAQNTNSLLGKVLRIDVSGDDFPGDPERDYAIPVGNAFASGGGAPEIYALGLRNPFRASVDVTTGDFYIGDVGQDEIEEIDRINFGETGLNFGWNLREGTDAFQGGADSPDFTDPLIDYAHGSGDFEGNSIVGGLVYRGSITGLTDTYIFADTISANVWVVPLSQFRTDTTVSGELEEFIRLTDQLNIDSGELNLPTSFGVDAAGALLITDLDGELFRLSEAP